MKIETSLPELPIAKRRIDAASPVVSILCTTYNHSEYIRDCLDGFLLQETTFPVEIIVRDDASTDCNATIIREYEAKYPWLFRNIYETENQHSKGVKPFRSIWPKARGKYIALCEGDDYWSDPLKLEKQFKVLEGHPEVVCCHHWHEFAVRDNQGSWVKCDAPKQGHGYNPQQMTTVEDIFANQVRCKTRTLFFRNLYSKEFYPEWTLDVAFGDVPLTFLLGQYGKFYFIDEVMAVYRQTGQGVSRLWRDTSEYVLKHYSEWIKIWDYAVAHYSYEYAKVARVVVLDFYQIIIRQSGVFNVLLFLRLFFSRMNRSECKLAYDGWILTRLPIVFFKDRLNRLQKRFFSWNEKS